MTIQGTFARRPSYALLAAGIGGGVLALCLAGVADSFVERALLFYGGTSLAYALMPYVRRGDIPLAAMWVVLAAEFAPLTRGQLISPVTIAADVVGVVMAAGPIYIARARQVLQGDTQARHRREAEPRRI